MTKSDILSLAARSLTVFGLQFYSTWMFAARSIAVLILLLILQVRCGPACLLSHCLATEQQTAATSGEKPCHNSAPEHKQDHDENCGHQSAFELVISNLRESHSCEFVHFSPYDGSDAATASSKSVESGIPLLPSQTPVRLFSLRI
jgi:hypothetical protein